MDTISVNAANFSDQFGTTLIGNGSYVGDFNNGDHVTYGAIDFGPNGSTKSINIRYSKAIGGGRLQLRLGGKDGLIIGEFTPELTHSAYTFQSAYIALTRDVEGVHDLSFVGVHEGNANSIMDIESFKLTGLDQSEGLILSRVGSLDYTHQVGTYIQGEHVRQSNNRYFQLEYENVNFGPSGTTKSIKVRYTKDVATAKIEIRLGRGTEGQLIAEMEPEWPGMIGFTTVNFPLLDDVVGVHDLTIIGRNKTNFALDWFQLSDEAAVFPMIPAVSFSEQEGTKIDNRWGQYIEDFDNDDFATYKAIDFGPDGTSKSLRMGLVKVTDVGGKLELRLGGRDGKVIGQFYPHQEYGPGSGRSDVYRTEYIAIDSDISGVHDLTFVAKHQDDVLRFNWFQLTPDVMYDNWSPYGEVPAIHHDVGPLIKNTGAPSAGGHGGPIAMSADAHTIVIGTGWISHNNTYLRMSVYRYNTESASWGKLGSNINGLQYLDNKNTTYFGRHVAMSNDGNRIVAGTNTRPGEVTVLDYVDGDWKQAGQTIVGRNTSGRTVSISGDGSKIFVGSPSYYNVYELKETNGELKWERLGSAIRTDHENSEGATSISDDGTRIAIGDQSSHNNYGSIRVYDYSGERKDWIQIFEVKGEFERDWVGYANCSLSGDGSTLVSIGQNTNHKPNDDRVSKVRIYRVGESVTEWKQIGGDIFGPSWGETNRNNTFGRSTAAAISFYGNVIAIEAIKSSDYGRDPRSGFIRVYKYNNGKDVWTRIGSDIWGASMLDGDFGKGLAMSHDGSQLAVSSENSRNIYVYQNPDAKDNIDDISALVRKFRNKE